MSDRRYNEEEVAAIFARATEVQQAAPRQLPSNEGMSLAELQAIGHEAGISPELVAEAARAVDRPAPPSAARLLGFTIGVAHTVELGRKLSDDEWERFVVQLRETFEARGKQTAEGSFRSWSNGNLHVMLEPSDDGHRVRFRTEQGQARGFLMASAGISFASVAIVISSVATGAVELGAAISSVGGMAIVAAGFFTAAVVRLPGWLKLRREQMQRLGAQLLAKYQLKP